MKKINIEIKEDEECEYGTAHIHINGKYSMLVDDDGVGAAKYAVSQFCEKLKEVGVDIEVTWGILKNEEN